jgi:anti-anti-sigma factor
MTSAIFNPIQAVTYSEGELTELVRGHDEGLVQRLAPLARQSSVLLDLRHVERIDAAGIAALISLYGIARDSGHSFSIVNASARVAEILRLVGLDRILASRNADLEPHCGSCFERPAA